MGWRVRASMECARSTAASFQRRPVMAFFFTDAPTTEIYTLSLHDALPIYAAFLGTINPDTNKIPKHLFQGYLNIYNNYFKAPWMPDRTEANPNELNQDDARYGFRCCHLKNIWTAPLPPETE